MWERCCPGCPQKDMVLGHPLAQWEGSLLNMHGRRYGYKQQSCKTKITAQGGNAAEAIGAWPKRVASVNGNLWQAVHAHAPAQ